MNKRIAVAEAYPGKKWKEKVTRMTEDQITAIWFRLRKQGKV